MVDDIVVGEGTIRPHEPRIVAVVAEVVRARRYSPVGMVDTDADAVVDITLRVDKIRPIAPTCVRVRRFSRRKSILYNFKKNKVPSRSIRHDQCSPDVSGVIYSILLTFV